MRIKFLMFLAAVLGVRSTYGPPVIIVTAPAEQDVVADCDFCIGDHGDYICTRECACECHTDADDDNSFPMNHPTFRNEVLVQEFRELLDSSPTRADRDRNTRPRHTDN